MELVRTTEAAALAASDWVGRGDKEGADGAAVDAMRLIMGTVQMTGTVIIGEGEKDEAPMLYNGEVVGDGSDPQVDIAVDPVEGTTLTATGRGGATSIIAVSEKGSMFDPGPIVYMEKIAVGPEAAGVVDIRATVAENLKAVAKAKGLEVREITAMVLDRPRHAEIVDQCIGRLHTPNVAVAQGQFTGRQLRVEELFVCLIGQAIAPVVGQYHDGPGAHMTRAACPALALQELRHVAGGLVLQDQPDCLIVIPHLEGGGGDHDLGVVCNA